MSKSNLGPITAVRVFVNDLDGSKDFYRNKLGLTLSLKMHPVLIFQTGVAQLILEHNPEPDAQHAGKVGRFTGVSFDVDDINDVHAYLTKNGVAFTMNPTLQPWGGIIAHFKDPDDNILTLVQHP